MSLTTLWNIFMHMDKFLAVNYGYQVKLNSSIISDCVSFSFFDWCHFINNLSHQIKSLEPIGPDDFISTLTSSGIFEYVLVGTGIATLFVA
jgi:hypothetical protein